MLNLMITSLIWWSMTENSHSQNSIVSNIELRRLSEEIFEILPNNLYSQISINYQNQNDHKNTGDMAPERLFNVSTKVLNSLPTIKLMRRLYDNYRPEVWEPETDTYEENREEDEFISALLETNVILHAMKFLANKGYIKYDKEEYKRILKLIWFHLYPRERNIYGSSGFEHVYLTEKKTRVKLIGLHNWIFFAEEEVNGRLNYLGNTHQIQLNDKADLAFVQFSFDGTNKNSSMFIGTPPELEIALYTVCFFVKPGKTCRFYTKGKTFSIQTHVIKSEGKDFVATAYPKF